MIRGPVLELTEKIKSIVADSFNLLYEEVTLDTGPSNTASWDSFGQMNLVLNIEKEFDITLEFDEIFKISTESLPSKIVSYIKEDGFGGKILFAIVPLLYSYYFRTEMN